MRDVKGWWRSLLDDLREHVDKDDRPDNLASFFKAEYGVWLAETLGVHPKDIWAVLAMSEYVQAHWTPEEKSMIAISSFYIGDDRRTWNEVIQEYSAINPKLRLFNLDEDGMVAGHIPLSVITKNRASLYRRLSATSPTYVKSKHTYAELNKKYRYRVRTIDGRRVDREVTLPETWSVPQEDHFINMAVPASRPATIKFDELLEVAQFLDALEDASRTCAPLLTAGHWVQRLDNIVYKEFQPDGLLKESREILLKDTVHLPGTLSVGKSTLASLIAIWSALKGYRITLIYNDVSSILKLVEDVNRRLLHPLIKTNPDLLPKLSRVENTRFQPSRQNPSSWAVPILGRRSRDKHVGQLYQDLYETAKAENVSHLDHFAWRYLNTACAVDAISIDAEEFVGPIPAGEFPCDRLNEPDSEDERGETGLVCPLINICPVHEASRDLADAPIWACSPASLVSSRVFSTLSPNKMSYYELVYRMSDIVIVDECDQAQSNFDDMFLPDSILAGPGQGHLLNDLAQRVARMRTDKRGLREQASRRWVRAVEVTNSVVDLIYDILTSPAAKKIRGWIGDGVFWNMNLFSMIVWELMGVKPEDCTPEQKRRHEQWLNRLGIFASSPLDINILARDELLSDLNQIASALVTGVHNKQIQIRCAVWVERAKAEIRSSKSQKALGNTLSNAENYWSSTAGMLEFAILVCILDDQLTLCELNWAAAPSDLNLDQYSSLQEKDRELRPYVPAPPTGRIFGFQYKHTWHRPDSDGILRRVRFAGVGRWALMHFHDLFFHLDGVKGPQALLLSGTSWSPSSPFFHVHLSPVGILDTKIQEKHVTDWLFKPIATHSGLMVSISGTSGDQRQEALQTAARLIARPGQAISQVLDEITQRACEKNRVWDDRQRILLLTGSYEETTIVSNAIHQMRPDLNVACMSRGGELVAASSAGLIKVGTGDVNRLASLYPQSRVLVAPIDAIGRGRNILNSFGKAAFGSIFFLIRSLLPPNDPSSDARHLIHWILSKDPVQVAREKFGVVAEDLRRQARDEWYHLMSSQQYWKSMADEDRRKLAATLFTRIWQAVGRGIRGNVPVIVVFVDAKWAPESARDQADSARTSLLVAMRECYEDLIFGHKPNSLNGRESQIAAALYQEPIVGLQQIQGLGSHHIEETL